MRTKQVFGYSPDVYKEAVLIVNMGRIPQGDADWTAIS